MSDKKHVWDKVNNWEEELLFLKAIIDKTELVETVKWSGPVYVYNKKNVIGIGGFKEYFTIWFFNGVFLKDEKKKLINAQEDKTKSLRQWRFTSKDQINEAEVLTYILEAIENEKQGKIIKPSKKEAIVSELFQKELDQNSALTEAFQKFSPYKQYEFLEYIETAKQDKTKLSRIEKVIPMILENIGLNDKYR
ncbi:YdeI/OmpD-associated family protein [Flavobacterium lipolyticum]|uniref:YdeI/OmpD-associated family protein n=1 Tax=Flavobacterium lipolyticum TaxID=2893754 RepID=A0ABS8M2I6_9FLAO|nr:YdeI/OmpD-associated family protein [Flavobacterium sp. F-126]MCC9019050.1 YdeI/OmpD-associated family protein [Flavobacterium sp. F-126]